MKYHSTNQFRNAVKTIKDSAKYKGQDSEGNVIIDELATMPTLEYIGTVKLHGTNGSIVAHEDGSVTLHSKSKLLATLEEDGGFSIESDNACFAQTLIQRVEGLYNVISKAKDLSTSLHGKILYPIKISGEWVGNGIQKGVGICELQLPSFFIFGVKLGETDQVNKTGWLPLDKIKEVSCTEHNFYNIMDFPTKKVSIDFGKPEYSLKELEDATLEVEECCPVSEKLGLGENLVGEGLVWTPVDQNYVYDTGTWFKTKGEKHSVTKVKKVVSVDVEKLKTIEDFVEYSVTENRLIQGVSEIGLDTKSIGAFIGWVNKDIHKEEADTLNQNDLTMKDVGKYIANISRKFYIEQLNKEKL